GGGPARGSRAARRRPPTRAIPRQELRECRFARRRLPRLQPGRAIHQGHKPAPLNKTSPHTLGGEEAVNMTASCQPRRIVHSLLCIALYKWTGGFSIEPK